MSLADHYTRLLYGEPIELVEAGSAFGGLRPARTRAGSYVAINDRLSSMNPGEWFNILKIIRKGSLPYGVESARLYRMANGFNVSVNYYERIIERHHIGPEMTIDDLREYLMQIKEEIIRGKEAETRGEKVERINVVEVRKDAG